MTEESDRPDPDALLRQLKDDEKRSARGSLRIFFGFAPGVGKTYRMLQVAHELAATQGVRVVVGIVEDHRRSETAAMVDGLEVMKRRKVEYRGRTLDEFDLDAALARRPDVLLVDELAHTNAPGSRHPKRWQDVEELLAAGIDVLSTMNVQHVESLNDVVAQITGVRVRETVPDSVIDEADAIEIVDIAPEELLERLRAGKVYVRDQAARASENFFQRGNLLALRELALRRTAQHVERDVIDYREEHGVASTWPTGERILVCVGPAPSSARLIRSTARMAAGLRCPWVAAYVESIAGEAGSEQDRERLDVHFRLAESLGATIVRLPGERVAAALLGYARKHNVTRIIIGKPTHSRFRDRLGGSLVDTIIRGSGEIDVHVISGLPSDRPTTQTQVAPRERAALRHYVWSAMVVAFTLLVALLLRNVASLPDLEMLFLLAVIVTAITFGRGPSILAAALGVACYDFFFVPPFHTFDVEDRRYFLTFTMMFGVGFVMSELASRLKRQEREALAREQRAAVLYALTSDLSSAGALNEIPTMAARRATSLFARRAVVLVDGPDGQLTVAGAYPEGAELDARGLSVARWCFEHDEPAGTGTDTLPETGVTCAPLRSGAARMGVLALVEPHRSTRQLGQRAFLEVFCRQVAVALERVQLAAEARAAALRATTEEMRSSLLSAVSHDLRTPLASITGAATTLRDESSLDIETRRGLIEAIVEQADRLERLVANLMDMTRLEAGGLALKRDWVPVDEMIGSALTRLDAQLGARAIDVEVGNDVPLLYVDPVLFEQILVNLLENANKYTPEDASLEIRARKERDSVLVEVADHGPGLAPGSERQIFEKFYRGPHDGIAGAGLGLAICKGIAEAHGGTIAARTAPEGGAVFTVTIPSGESPPPVPESTEAQ